MKLSPYVSTLHLYDVVSTAGVAADVSHINTPAKASGLQACLRSWHLLFQVMSQWSLRQPHLPNAGGRVHWAGSARRSPHGGGPRCHSCWRAAEARNDGALPL